MIWVSYTQLKLFEQCPKAYKYRYVEKLPSKVKPVLLMANSVHAALKDFFLIADTEQRTKPVLEDLLRKAWRSSSDRKKAFKTTLEEKTYGEKAIAMLGSFFDKHDIKAKPAALEEFYKVPYDANITLCGKVDRIDTSADGSLIIIDYKTGKPPADKDEFLNTDYQLGMYGILVRKKMLTKIEKIMYIYLENYQELSLSPTVEYLENVYDKVINAAKVILAEKEFLPKPGSFCRICDFTDQCDCAKTAPVKQVPEPEEVPF
ncbi:MAG: hypothetical protein A2252_02690 [Elusimicrobia bacterium RIFOXYA2_FULL_39_19]|nr:MAG: hypothetical protein A2252_02690 [Elusimicrobia bacterium RIFOXYA2_FULL_39_19]